jgi:Tol biopolymer transport system component
MARLVFVATLILTVVSSVVVAVGVAVGTHMGYFSENIILYRIAHGSSIDQHVDGLRIYDDRYGLVHQYKMGCIVYSFAWSPDGDDIALSAVCPEAGSALYIMDYDGRNRRQITALSPIYGDIRWSPDEAYLFYINKENVSPHLHTSLNVHTGISEIWAKEHFDTGKYEIFSDEVVDPSDYPRARPVTGNRNQRPPAPQGWFASDFEWRPAS